MSENENKCVSHVCVLFYFGDRNVLKKVFKLLFSFQLYIYLLI